MDNTTSSEHQVALKAYLQQLETRVKALELKIDSLENWKEKQPCYIISDGKWEIVPGCFD